MPERELSIEAGEQIQPEDRQSVDHHQGQLEDDKTLEEKGYQQRCDQRRGDGNLAGARAETRPGARRGRVKCYSLPPRYDHTRLTTARPKIPVGLAISTATISTRAIVS